VRRRRAQPRHLTQDPPSPEEEPVSGFKKFLLRGNLVDLAVAVVVGAAFSSVVSALVRDLITPLITAIGGKPDFSALYFTVHHSKFSYGDLVNAAVAFLIVAAVVYFLVLAPVTRLVAFTQRHKEAVERECPECLSSVPVAAKRCRYCTSSLTPAGTAASAASDGGHG
jgi:large conductance mechanosensitive channel